LAGITDNSQSCI